MLAKSRKIVNAATAKVFERLSNGWTDDKIRRDMGLDSDQYKLIKRLMLDDKTGELRAKPQDHILLEYILEQRGNIRTLDKVVKELKGSNQYNAVVGAIRLKADISDRILTRLQEFDVVRKAPERKMVAAGVVVQDMSNTDLMEAIRDQIEAFQSMFESYGERSFLALPARPTHYGPSADDVEATGASADDDDDDEEDDEASLLPAKKKASGSSRK